MATVATGSAVAVVQVVSTLSYLHGYYLLLKASFIHGLMLVTPFFDPSDLDRVLELEIAIIYFPPRPRISVV